MPGCTVPRMPARVLHGVQERDAQREDLPAGTHGVIMFDHLTSHLPPLGVAERGGCVPSIWPVAVPPLDP